MNNVKKVMSEINDKLESRRKSDDVNNVLRSSGKSRAVHDLPVLQFYLDENSEYPSVMQFADIVLNYYSLRESIAPHVQEVLFTKRVFDDNMDFQPEQVFLKLKAGYMAEITLSYHTIDFFAPEFHDELRKHSSREGIVHIAVFHVYCPADDSKLRDEEFEKDIVEIVRKNKLSKTGSTPCVGMIVSEDGEYYIKEFYIKTDYSIKDADLHYGKDFEKFHHSLLSRFRSDTKGLVLFHGTPGTGKTYYIRSLLRDLVDMKKYVIYVPPAMVDTMIDPGMMNFLSTTAMEKSEEGISCVLLIEDAEPLLSSRSSDDRTTGITNLLNVTDGLLNDMLSFQVIATFNTEIAKIDKALLRPERLIARKEFKKLRKEDAQKLIDKLGISMVAEDEMTLADIYSVSKSREILVHEYSSETRKMGF